MAIDPIDTKLIDTLLAGYKKPEDIIGKNGLLKQLTKALLPESGAFRSPQMLPNTVLTGSVCVL